MENLITQREFSINQLFDERYLNGKALYLHCFQLLPCIHHIGQIDGERTYMAITQKYGQLISRVYRYSWYKQKQKEFAFDRTVLILKNNCVIELDDDYCEILHDGSDMAFPIDIAGIAALYKEKQRRQPLEFNLIVNGHHGLSLQPMAIKRTTLDVDLFYEDDFKEVDELIRQRLRKKNDKGIVLLHGLPGTGKTSYLRYLVGKIRKKVLFLSPSVAGNLMNPEFIELLTRNPNSVLIIEDAENIIMDRKHTSSSSVSNLLNISDGLLADFLNVQLICTFNSSLTLVDNALLRKGRLIARYEFGKLGVVKSRRLSGYLGFTTEIDKPMTIAEITNPNQKEEKSSSMEVIGFRRQEVMMN